MRSKPMPLTAAQIARVLPLTATLDRAVRLARPIVFGYVSPDGTLTYKTGHVTSVCGSGSTLSVRVDTFHGPRTYNLTRMSDLRVCEQ